MYCQFSNLQLGPVLWQKLSTISAVQINTYDVVKNAKLVISKQAVQQIEEVYGE